MKFQHYFRKKTAEICKGGALIYFLILNELRPLKGPKKVREVIFYAHM